MYFKEICVKYFWGKNLPMRLCSQKYINMHPKIAFLICWLPRQPRRLSRTALAVNNVTGWENIVFQKSPPPCYRVSIPLCGRLDRLTKVLGQKPQVSIHGSPLLGLDGAPWVRGAGLMETRVCPAIERRPMGIRLARGQQVACLGRQVPPPCLPGGQVNAQNFEASYNSSVIWQPL